MNNIKEQADSYVEIFKPHVNPYVGSGMLSNTFDDGAIAWQSTHCAIIHVEGLINVLSSLGNVYASIEAYKYIRILEELKSRI